MTLAAELAEDSGTDAMVAVRASAATTFKHAPVRPSNQTTTTHAGETWRRNIRCAVRVVSVLVVRPVCAGLDSGADHGSAAACSRKHARSRARARSAGPCGSSSRHVAPFHVLWGPPSGWDERAASTSVTCAQELASSRTSVAVQRTEHLRRAQRVSANSRGRGGESVGVRGGTGLTGTGDNVVHCTASARAIACQSTTAFLPSNCRANFCCFTNANTSCSRSIAERSRAPGLRAAREV